MPFIVETGPRHPGIKLYVTEVNTAGRRRAFSLLGNEDKAFRFPSRAAASNSLTGFSSLYRLEIVEEKEPSHAV